MGPPIIKRWRFWVLLCAMSHGEGGIPQWGERHSFNPKPRPGPNGFGLPAEWRRTLERMYLKEMEFENDQQDARNHTAILGWGPCGLTCSAKNQLYRLVPRGF